MINKKLIFLRAWNTYKIKMNHGVFTTFSSELKNCYNTAKLIGYENYKQSINESYPLK